MNAPAGYDLAEKLYESAATLVYRARRRADEHPVILKMLHGEVSDDRRLRRFRREFELTRRLAEAPGIIEVHDFALDAGGRGGMLVLEDVGGQSLAAHLKQRQSNRIENIEEFLAIAIHLARALEAIHGARLVHRDINPANIVWNPEHKLLRIIDFGIAEELTASPLRESPGPVPPTTLEGTLAFISPEQTGRINRPVDHRSDLYSAGATLYRLLCGRNLFDARDPMEMVHAHLAKEPVPLQEIRPDVPASVVEVVRLLLARDPEERYRSARGLHLDLCEIHGHLEPESGRILLESFRPGRDDMAPTFELPRKLYGRDEERRRLLAAFARASTGRAELLLVRGDAGSGKSALVREIHRPITEKHGYFAAGKFDPETRNVPYSALRDALHALISQLLTEHKDSLAVWKHSLLAALGSHVSTLVEVLPRAALIFGESLPEPAPPSGDNRRRLSRAFQAFLNTFATRRQPLALFLDDLQWADSASLELLEEFLADPRSNHVLVIGACRDSGDETSADESPRRLRERFQAEEIVLTPLGEQHIAAMLADACDLPAEETLSLAKLCFEKTRGNPFFLNQFLGEAQEFFYFEKNADRGRWYWDAAAIAHLDATANAVRFLTARLSNLSPGTRQFLEFAACLGDHFDLRTLEIIAPALPYEWLKGLWDAVRMGFVVPLDDEYKYINPTTGQPGDANPGFRFLHDQVREAVLSLIDQRRRCEIHLEIGIHLRDGAGDVDYQRYLFEIVEHLNAGSPLMDRPRERTELARWNLRAGRRARTAAAFRAAYSYFRFGLLQCDPGPDSDPDLTLALQREAAETAHLCGETEARDRLVAAGIKLSRSFLEEVSFREIEIQAFVANNQLQEAIAVALPVLRKLGAHVPSDGRRTPGKATLLYHLLRLRMNLGVHYRRPGLLAALRPMTEPRYRAALRILTRVGVAAYYSAPELFLLICFEMTRLSVRYGNAPESCPAYAACGSVICAALGDVKTGYEFGRVALELAHRPENAAFRSITATIFHGLIRHWRDDLASTLPGLQRAHADGIEYGDLVHASTAASAFSFYEFLAGQNVRRSEETARSYLPDIENFGMDTMTLHHRLLHQFLRCLAGESDDPLSLDGDDLREAVILQEFDATANTTGRALLYVYKLMLAAILSEVDAGIDAADRAEEYVAGLTAYAAEGVFHFYAALIRIIALRRGYSRRGLDRRIRGHVRKLQFRAHHAPTDFKHRLDLVRAELERSKGRYERSTDLFDAAARSAREADRPLDLALIYERAADLHRSLGRTLIAETYLRSAYFTYRACGADAKVRALESRYAPILPAAATLENRRGRPGEHETETRSSEETRTLDLRSVIKSSQAIAEQISLTPLLEKLVRILIENAGARRGLLFLERENRLVLSAEGTAQSSEVRIPGFERETAPEEVGEDTDARDTAGAPRSLLNYVLRSREAVVLDDAAEDPRFQNDPYVRLRLPRSVLCMPVLHRGNALGVLYLENDLISGAFTPERLETLNLLSSQAAVSLQNAVLYDGMEREIERRTVDLNRALEELKFREDLYLFELDVAGDIQHTLLPQIPYEFAPVSSRPLRIEAYFRPMAGVGGDFYDIIPMNAGKRLALLLADASGHGVPAALFTTMVKVNFADAVRRRESPLEILSYMNDSLTGTIASYHYLTAVCLIFADDGSFTYSSAGHPRGLIHRSGDASIDVMETSGMILGVFGEASLTYENHPERLNPGDRLLVYTDGMTEAVDVAGRVFGDERVKELLEDSAHLPLDEARKSIEENWCAFVGNAKVQDDVTFLLIEYR